MARADLLLNLVRAGSEGDQVGLRRAVEAMVAEERAKHHPALASRLEAALKTGASQGRLPSTLGSTEERARQYLVELQPRRTLSSIVLSDEVAAQIAELIEEQHRTELLRSYGLEPRHRVLLFGPPGNGKTSLAEALAFELSLPLLVVRYETLIGSFLGETSQRLKQVFDFARSRHCVLFFDEFDAVAKERGDVHETGEIKRVVNSLLMQIDDLPTNVLIVVASNHSELLDRAVWRRFQLRLELLLPDARAIQQWFARLQERLQIPFGLPIASLVKYFDGRSYSDLVEFSENVARRMVLASPDANMKKILEKQIQLRTSSPRKRRKGRA
jgi:SpoVK/Ycf46/Vps4 family AAA+-type ATPase